MKSDNANPDRRRSAGEVLVGIAGTGLVLAALVLVPLGLMYWFMPEMRPAWLLSDEQQLTTCLEHLRSDGDAPGYCVAWEQQGVLQSVVAPDAAGAAEVSGDASAASPGRDGAGTGRESSFERSGAMYSLTKEGACAGIVAEAAAYLPAKVDCDS